MRIRLMERFRFSEIRKDRWIASKGEMSAHEVRGLRIRRAFYFAYLISKSVFLLPVIIFRGIYHLFLILAEFESLHFAPLRRIRRGIDCVVDRQTWFVNGNNIILGDFVKISAFSSVMAGYVSTIRIGTNTIIGPGALIASFNHGYELEEVPMRYQAWKETPADSIVIEDDVWLGGNVVVLPGTRIGSGSIIGAGVVVKGVIPPRTIVYGKDAHGKR